MPRPDEQRPARATSGSVDPESHALAPVSKTRRKAAMHALQDVGEALVALEPRQLDRLFAQVEMPERLREAILQARTITAWGGRKRQLQYVGKLMREVDPAPIEQWLADLAHGRQQSAKQQHAIEDWRERLLADPEALDQLAAEHPGLDRSRLRALVARAREERQASRPPRAYRELFRALKALLEEHDEPPPPTA